MNVTLLRIAARMLREAEEAYSNHGCNDYQLPATPANIEFVKGMILASDYPDDDVQIVSTYQPQGYVRDQKRGKGIVTFDYRLMLYCAKQLEQLADELARGKRD